MKKTLLQCLVLLALLSITSCKQASNNETGKEDASSNLEMVSSAKYADFDKKVATIQAFFKAHSDENLAAQSEMLSDSLQWSPTVYNGNQWLGKEDFLAAIKGYHDTYDNIRYQAGVVTADSIAGGFFSGSVFPKETAESDASVIRIYGTWTGTHVQSGQNIGLKFFALASFDEAGKIALMSDYFDLSSIMPKDVAE